MLFLHHARLARERHAAREKGWLAVSHAEGLERAVLREQFKIDVTDGDFHIEMQPLLELLRAQDFARAVAEGIAKLFEGFATQRKPGGHFVTAVFFQMRAAFCQRGHQRKPVDASSAALSHALFIKADHERRAMMLPQQTRRHDPDHTRMPPIAAHHDRRMTLRIEPLRKLLLRLRQHLIFHRPTLAILHIEIRRQRTGARAVFGEQKFQRFLRRAESSCRIHPRADFETDIGRRERRTHRRDIHQLAQPDGICAPQPQ